MTKIEWLGDDGPCVLLAQSTAAGWVGSDGDDYEHACAALEDPAHAAVVPFEGGHALALETSGHQVALVRAEDGVIVVKWIFAPSETAAARAVSVLGEDIAWRETGCSWTVPVSGVLLQAAGEAHGAESVPFDLRDGTYHVATALFEPDSDSSFELFRLRRIG